MISPNFDNTPCKLYNQDTGELVAVGKIDNALAISKEEHEEYLKREPAMTFDACSITLNMPRGFAKSLIFSNIMMEGLAMAKEYYRHNSFDILKVLEESGYGSGRRVNFYQGLLLGELKMRKKCPRGRRNVHRRKYAQKLLKSKYGGRIV